jgi:hypothetical protein
MQHLKTVLTLARSAIVGTIDDSTAKEILYTLHRAAKTPTPYCTQLA